MGMTVEESKGPGERPKPVCYGLNVCPPTHPVYVLKPQPPVSQCDGIRNWCLWEVTRFGQDHGVGAPMMGLGRCKGRKGLESSLSLHHIRTQQESCCVNQEVGPRQKPHHDLRLPVSRTIRKKCLLVQPASLWRSVIAAQAHSDQSGMPHAGSECPVSGSMQAKARCYICL